MTSNGPTSIKSDRVGAVRRLSNRKFREKVERFLAEGPQVVREAVRRRPDVIDEVYVAHDAGTASQDIAAEARATGVRVTQVPEQVLLAMTETVHPQGIAAVCRFFDAAPVDLDARLLVVLHEVRDPGNAGTILRTADAAGADGVVFTGDSVDPYNGKCVRSTAGSLFHVPFWRSDVSDFLSARPQMQVLATSGSAERDLRNVDLTRPTAWLLGNEAHGLPALDVETVSIPIFGDAESLNLASAAAVCLYSSAFAQRG